MPNGRALTPVLPAEMRLDDYARSYAEGRTPDRYPYGLEHLPSGWHLTEAKPRFANRLTMTVRRAVRWLVQADLVGALQQSRSIREADVIYAHNEVDYLGAALVLRLFRATRPFLVGQTIWLFAEWDRQPAWRRLLFRWLISRVDLFVYNAEPNRDLGARMFPSSIHEYIPFGVSNVFQEAEGWAGGRTSQVPLVLSVGNDRARDWATLAEATREFPEPVEVRLATNHRPVGMEHATIRATKSIDELCALYRDAAVLVTPVLPNCHASGITSMLEGAGIGVPMVAASAGGLESYFSESEVAYFPPGDVEALRSRILDALDGGRAAERAKLAAEAARTKGFDNRTYWRRVLGVVEAHSRRS